MNKKSLKVMTRLAVVAALYVALTLALYPLSYGSIQFRISEFLIILVCYNPVYSISLIIGCLIANMASPLGLADVVFGTLATVISVLIMPRIKNKYISSLIPSIVNAIVVGIELYFVYSIPFYLAFIEVFIGEFVVVSLIGLPVFKSLENNNNLAELLGLNVNRSKDSKFSARSLISFVIMIIGIVLFFYLGVYYIYDDSSSSYTIYSLYIYTFGVDMNQTYPLFIFALVMPIMAFASSLLLKKKISCFVNIFLIVVAVVFTTIELISLKSYLTYDISAIFYIYYLYFLIAIIYEIFTIVHINKNQKNLSDNMKSNIYQNINN